MAAGATLLIGQGDRYGDGSGADSLGPLFLVTMAPAKH